MSTFRLAILNVHLFRNPSIYDSNINDLVSILEPLNLDLIAVEEIQNDHKWKKFYSRLSLHHSIYGKCNEDIFGNGIASRYPILSHSNKSSISCPGETRSLLQCRLDGDHTFIQNRLFALTHLDHLDEDNRLKQLKQFNPYKENIHILMGDMNALTREDYSDDYYRKKIVDVRENSGWEKPRFDLKKLITNEWGYQDAFKLINPQLKDEEVATCDYGTRIDYIYLHPHVNDQWTLTKCQIIDTKGATDHHAVFAEFELII
jgi:endonuclease/exonuclease/phosphatase family metal-dependent hydrolase